MASEIKVDTVSEKTSGSGVTIDGLLIKDGGISGDVSLIGTTPTFTIGDAGAEDATLVFDGNAQDYYVGLDDSSDSLVLGLGSALGTTPAMTINSSQVVTFAQNPVFPDGGVAVADLDIDGATDIGAAIVDADLFIIDDGAGGTNRKTTASRLKTYIGGSDPASADGDTLGTASLEWSDLYLADSSVIYFGNDQDTTLTHTDGTGLTLNSTNKLCFNDASQFIQGASATVLDIAATDEIELTATLLDVNANLDVSGTSLLPTLGVITAKDLGAGIHIRTADSGASVASQADELVIENSDHAGLSILTGTDKKAYINFGDSGNNGIGRVMYDHNIDSMRFLVSETDVIQIKSDGDIFHPLDDKGIVFGAGNDIFIGAAAGEEAFQVMRGSGQGTSVGTGASVEFYVPGTSSPAEVVIYAGEAKAASVKHVQDQGDDNADQWWVGQQGNAGNAGEDMCWTDYDSGSMDQEARLNQAGDWATEGTHTASTTIDYAEYFEWKTELANDDKITETYGLSVVLDNGKVRLAEAGEEAKVLGVVRPNNVSAMVGGEQLFRWKGRYQKKCLGRTCKRRIYSC